MVSFYSSFLQYESLEMTASIMSKVFSAPDFDALTCKELKLVQFYTENLLFVFFKQMKYASKEVMTFCKHYGITQKMMGIFL